MIRRELMSQLIERAKKTTLAMAAPLDEVLTSDEQQYLVTKGITFTIDRMGKMMIGYSQLQRAQDLRDAVASKRANNANKMTVQIQECSIPDHCILIIRRSEKDRKAVHQQMPTDIAYYIKELIEADQKKSVKSHRKTKRGYHYGSWQRISQRH